MTKKLLTIGHICTLRDGSVAVILSDKLGNLRVTNRRLALSMNHYNDDLTHKAQSRYDIITVSETPSFILSIQHLFDADSSKYRESVRTLWSSKEPEILSSVSDASDGSSDEVNAFDAMVNATRKLFPNINVQIINADNIPEDVPTAIKDIVAKIKSEMEAVRANSKPKMEEIAEVVSAKISKIKLMLEGYGASADTIQKAVEDYIDSLKRQGPVVAKEPEVGEPVSIDESLIIERNAIGTFVDEEIFLSAQADVVAEMKASGADSRFIPTSKDMFAMYVKTVVKSIKKFNKKFGYNPNEDTSGNLHFKSSGDKDMYMMLFNHYTKKHYVQLAEEKLSSISEE